MQGTFVFFENADLANSKTRHPVREARNSQGLRSVEHTSELQSQSNLVCRLLLEKEHNVACYLRAEGRDLLRERERAADELEPRACALSEVVYSMHVLSDYLCSSSPTYVLDNGYY